MTTFAATTKSGHQVDILKNPYATANSALFDVFVYILIPLFLAFAILFRGFGLEGATLTLAGLGIGLALAALYFFAIRSRQNAKLICFCVSQQSIELKKDQTIFLQFSDNIKVEHIGWGTELDTLLPAVRISNGITSFTIGTMEAQNTWSNVRQSVQFTDYIVPNTTQWNEFLACLSKAQ